MKIWGGHTGPTGGLNARNAVGITTRTKLTKSGLRPYNINRVNKSVHIPVVLGRPTYIHQDRPANCGPTSIVNALIYLGIAPECIDIYKIESEVKCSTVWGTGKSNIAKFLRKMGVKFSELKKPKIKAVEDALYDGYGVIYLYRVKDGAAHYVFFYGQTRRHFRVANDVGEKGNISMFRRKKSYYAQKAMKLRVHPKYKRYGTYPHAWVVKGIKGITPPLPVERDKETGRD